MKRLVLLLVVLSGMAQAQTAAGFGPALTATTQIPSNYVKVAPLSPVVVCAWPPTGGTPCTNKVTTYTDPSASVNCPSSAQVLSPGTTTCSATSDVFGNFSFFVTSPSTVAYYFKVGLTWNGPFVASVGGGTGVGAGTTGNLGIYTSGTSVGADVNIDDGVTTPGVVTVDVPVATPQINLIGAGGLAFGPTPGGALPTPGSGGGLGIGPGGIPQLTPDGLNWFAVPIIKVNGVAITNATNTRNFNSSTPAAPTNGINMQCQVDSNGNLSCAIVGDGNGAHAFCGNGTFAACTAGGATALSGLTAATGANTIANGNFGQIWQWALTGATAVGITDTESAAATGGTPLSQAVRQVSTVAGSTAIPLLVTDSLTGTQTLPAGYFNCAWNTSGVVDACLLVNAVNTASGGLSLLADFQVSGSTVEKFDRAGNIYATTYGGNGVGSNVNFCSGQANGPCASNNSNAQTGTATYMGSDNNNTGASAKAGPAIFRCGMLTAATPNAAALEGPCSFGAGYLKGSAIAAVGDVVCGTSTAFTVTDCSHTGPAVNVVGVATNTSNPIGVVFAGTALVKTDGAVTIGDILCVSATVDGQAHDNGTAACATAGATIGVVIATSGTIIQMSGNSTASTAMSTTLPLVALRK